MTSNVKKAKNYEINMCEGPIFSNMVKFAIGVLGTSVLQQLFNTADLLIVSYSGHKGAVASVSATSSITNLFINLFIGLSVGAGIVIAKHYGANEKEEASKCLHTSLSISIIAGSCLALIVWFLAPFVLTKMNTPAGVLNGAVTYMRIYFLGMPFMLLYNFSASILRAVGDSKRTFFYIIQAGIINVVLNLIFVLVFDMNVAGVALATSISQGYSAIRCINCFVHYDGILKLEWKKLRIYKKNLISITKVGIPSGIQSSLFSISNVLIQTSVNDFGDLAMEGSGVASNIESYIYFASNAVSNTVTNFTSQNFGANKPDRIKRVGILGFAMSTTLCASLGILALSFSTPLLTLFNCEKDALDFGTLRMQVICLSQFLCSAMEITTGLLRGIFRPLPAMLSSIAGVCLFRIIWINTVFEINHNFTVLYLSYPISWAISFIAQGILFHIYFKMYKNELARKNNLI